MTRFALAAFTAAALLSSSALAQTVNQSDPPLPANPSGSSANSADDNGINPTATPGAAPNGAVRDSTQSGDNGAHARQNSNGATGTTGSATTGPATTGSGNTGGSPLPQPAPAPR